MIRWIGDMEHVHYDRLQDGEVVAKAGYDFYAVPAGHTLVKCEMHANECCCDSCNRGGWELVEK